MCVFYMCVCVYVQCACVHGRMRMCMHNGAEGVSTSITVSEILDIDSTDEIESALGILLISRYINAIFVGSGLNRRIHKQIEIT